MRIYSANDICSASNPGLISSDMKIRKANSMRIEKEVNIDFDFNSSHVAKLCINDSIQNGVKKR